MTTIKLKNGSGAPTAGDLAQGEPALDLTNKRLYTEDSGGTVIEVGTNPGTDVTFADNRKAIFGAGSDLQIYHDGTNSQIVDAGAGILSIAGNSAVGIYSQGTGESMIIARSNAEVELYYDNAEKLATTSTGIDVTGTVTADGLTVDGTNGNFEVATTGNSVNMTRAGNNFITASDLSGDLYLGAGGSSFLKIDNGGDISFYEDTGTTAKLFWDASAERLGIGTSSPAGTLHLKGPGGCEFHMESGDGASTSVIKHNQSTDALEFYPDGSLAMTLQAGNQAIFESNVGIGTTSPGSLLELEATGATVFDGTATDGQAADGTTLAIQNLSDTNNTFSQILFRNRNTSKAVSRIASLTDSTGTEMAFVVENNGSPAEVLRLEKTGNVGVGTTSPSTALHVVDTTGDVLTLESDSLASSPNIVFKNTDGEKARINSVDAGELYFGTGSSGTERMRIDSSGNLLLSNTTSLIGANTSDGSDNKSVMINGGGSSSDTRGAYVWAKGNEHSDAGKLQLNAGNVSGAPIAFNTGGHERMRIDSSGNLLVSGTSTTPWGNATGTAADNQFIAREDGILGATAYKSTTNVGYVGYFNRTATDGGILAFNKNGTTVGSIGTELNRLFIGSDDSMIFFDAGSTNAIWPWTSTATSSGDADNTIDIGDSSNRFKDLYLSGGAYLGGTGSANKLDDYEEGTWTPEIVGSTTAGSYSSTIKIGTYTKVGQVVTVWGYFLGSSGTGAGDLNISGLPFSLATDAVGVIQGNAGLVYPSGTTDACLFGSGGTTLHVRCNKSDGTTYSKMAYPTSATYIRFTLSYRTA